MFTEVGGFYLLRLLGVKTTEGGKAAKVSKLSKSEVLLVNIGSTSTGGTVLAMKGDLAKIQLYTPVCTQEGEKIAQVGALTSTGGSSAGVRSARARNLYKKRMQIPSPRAYLFI